MLFSFIRHLRPVRLLQLALHHQTGLEHSDNYLSNSGDAVYFSWITWVITSSFIRWKGARATFWWFYCPLNNVFLFKRSCLEEISCWGLRLPHLPQDMPLIIWGRSPCAIVQDFCGCALLLWAEKYSCLEFLACSLCLWESSPQLMRWQAEGFWALDFCFCFPTFLS